MPANSFGFPQLAVRGYRGIRPSGSRCSWRSEGGGVIGEHVAARPLSGVPKANGKVLCTPRAMRQYFCEWLLEKNANDPLGNTWGESVWNWPLVAISWVRNLQRADRIGREFFVLNCR